MRKQLIIFGILVLLLFSGLAFAGELGSGAGTGYPDAIDTDAFPEQAGQIASENVPNDSNDAIIAIETELGTNPSSGFSTVSDYLDALSTAIQAVSGEGDMLAASYATISPGERGDGAETLSDGTVEVTALEVVDFLSDAAVSIATIELDMTNIQTTMATVRASVDTIEGWDTDNLPEGSTNKYLPTDPSTGDMAQWNGVSWVTVTIGNDNDVLTLSGETAGWEAPTGGGGAIPDQIVAYTALSLMIPSASDPVTAAAPNNYANCNAVIQIPVVEFDDTLIWARNFIIPVHEDFDTTSSISFEVHGMSHTAPATAKNVEFKIYWVALGSGDLYTSSYASIETGDLAVSTTQASGDILTFQINNTTMGLAPRDIVYCQISRIDANANDLAGHYQATTLIAYLKRE